MRQTFVFERTLNRLDALHYHLGELACCNVAMCMVAVLARDVGLGAMREAWLRAAIAVPRFRDVLRPVPWDLAPPMWVSSAEFDVAAQVSQTRLAPDAGWGEVMEIVDRAQSEGFPASRPPWHVDYVVGAPDGRAVVVLKLHHALSDGTALAAMLGQVFMREEIARAGVEIEAVGTPDPDGIAREAIRHWHATARAWGRRVRAATRDARPRWREEREAVRDYVRPATSPLAGRHARQRASASFRIPLAAWEEEARTRGGGVNELFLALAAAALRRYETARHGQAARAPLRIVMPVDVRDRSAPQDGGNVTAAGIVELGGDGVSGADLRPVVRAARAARMRASAAAGSVVDDVVASLPGRLQARVLFRRFANKDLLATNVVVPFECELDGVPVEMVFMVPPVIGPPVAFALAGYGGALHLSVNMDAGLVAAPAQVADGVASLLDEWIGAEHVMRLDGRARQHAATETVARP